jgi:hypothetical protein
MNPISRIAPVTDAEAAQMVHPGTLADLAEQLTSMPAEAAAAEDGAGSATWHSPRRRRRLLIAISAVAALAVTALLVTSLGVVTSPGPARHAGGVRNPIAWNAYLYPLGPPGGILGAKKTTVAGAQAKVGYPVPVPGTAAASRASLTQVWVAPHVGRQAALVFDRGKVDILMAPKTRQGALRWFRALVAQKKKIGVAAATLGQVNGRPALVVIEPGTNANGSKPAVVHFYRNGVLISIYSNTYGEGTLLAIAGSMH